MELRQLEYFVAVVEAGSFTRAADRVHISQSGVSAQVRRLERELGAELLHRGRTVTPTQAGEAAYAHACAALEAADRVRAVVDEVRGVLRGRVVAGMVTGCTVKPWFAALAAFHSAHPAVDIVLTEDTSDVLVDEVRDGLTDVALVGIPDAPAPALDVLTVSSERLVAVAPPGHRLAGRRRVRLADLADEPLVCLPPGTGIRTVFDRAAASAGHDPLIRVEAGAPEAVLDLARRGLGVAIVSASMAPDAPPIDIADRAALAVVTSPRPSPAASALVAHVRTAFTG